jgi:hypothetical protein
VLRKVLILFIVSCFCVHAPAIVAQSNAAQVTEAKHAKKIKNLVFKSPVGPGNDIEVTLRDKTKIKGYLSEVTDDYFVVTDPKSGATTRVEYGQVEKVRLWLLVQNALKRNFSSPARIIRNMAIGIGVGFTAVALICLASRRCVE